MISLIFIILASICNAVMDTCNHHYHISIFNHHKLKKSWWNGEVSWRNKYIDGNVLYGRTKIPVQLTDAFHFFKMLMIIFICLSIITFDKCSVLVYCSYEWYSFIILLLIYGILWNTTFSLFYKKLLIKQHE